MSQITFSFLPPDSTFNLQRYYIKWRVRLSYMFFFIFLSIKERLLVAGNSVTNGW